MRRTNPYGRSVISLNFMFAQLRKIRQKNYSIKSIVFQYFLPFVTTAAAVRFFAFLAALTVYKLIVFFIHIKKCV